MVKLLGNNVLLKSFPDIQALELLLTNIANTFQTQRWCSYCYQVGEKTNEKPKSRFLFFLRLNVFRLLPCLVYFVTGILPLPLGFILLLCSE